MFFLMLAAVLIFCLVCGACTSAKSIARGADRIRSQWRASTVAPGSCELDDPQATQVHGSNQRCMQDLKALFALYQSGALTREEFDGAKRHLLAGIKGCA